MASKADQLSFKGGRFCHRNLGEKMTEEKKQHRSSHFLRTKHESIEVLIRDKAVVEAFKKAGCWKFCKKLQGGHTQVTKEFVLHFSGLSTKFEMLNLQVSPEIIALVIEIPRIKGTPSTKTNKSAMSREKGYIKLKPRK